MQWKSTISLFKPMPASSRSPASTFEHVAHIKKSKQLMKSVFSHYTQVFVTIWEKAVFIASLRLSVLVIPMENVSTN